MLNFCVGLAFLTYWFFLYLPIRNELSKVIDFRLHDLVIFSGCLVLWVLIISIFKAWKIVSVRKEVSLPWTIVNALAVLTMIVHCYNSIFISPASSVEEIMSPGPTQRIELYLVVIFPFLRLAGLAGLIYVISLIVSRKRT